VDHVGYYAEAFSPQPGRCFRMVTNPTPGAQGSPCHCPQWATVRGTFTDTTGHRWRCESCPDHAGPLTDWRPIPPDNPIVHGLSRFDGFTSSSQICLGFL
jgi:hypothetical protein